MSTMYARRTTDCKRKCTPSALAGDFVTPHHLYMARKQYKPTFIRQWRTHRGYTLERLAEMIGTTHATLSRVERGIHPYNQEMLELLADALMTDAASLIMRDPTKPSALWSIWDQAKPAERDQISALAETVIGFRGKDGTLG